MTWKSFGEQVNDLLSRVDIKKESIMYVDNNGEKIEINHVQFLYEEWEYRIRFDVDIK